MSIELLKYFLYTYIIYNYLKRKEKILRRVNEIWNTHRELYFG